MENVWPQATIMPGSTPTRLYNCHAYAWHKIYEGTPWPIVVNILIDAYWEDGSFVTASPNTAGAIITYTGLAYKLPGVPFKTELIVHSGVVQASGKIVSKWGAYDLVEHDLAYTPYNEDSDELGMPVTYKYYTRNTPLEITGPSTPPRNKNVTYSVPAVTGVTFNNWTVTPSTYVVTGGLNSRNLTVRFTSAGTYTLSANFSLPNNTTYSATKTVTLTAPPPAPLLTGTFTSGLQQVLSRPHDPIPYDPPVPFPEGWATIRVVNGTPIRTTYQWSVTNAAVSPTINGLQMTLELFENDSSPIVVSCVATNQYGSSPAGSVTLRRIGPSDWEIEYNKIIII